MLKNYLKIAWRNLIKDKTFVMLNVTGLSIAFGAAILLAMAAFFDLSFEDFHQGKDRIFQVYNIEQTEKGPQAATSQPTPFARSLKEEVPGISKITRVLENGALVIHKEKEMVLDIIWTDADYFSIFTFPFAQGKEGEGLSDLSSVVMSPDAAMKLFGRTDVLGETIGILINGQEHPFTISAITQKSPKNTSLGFELAVRFENNPEYKETLDTWDARYHEVYVQLDQGVGKADFEEKTRPFVDLHYAETIENAKRDGAMANANGQFRELALLPLKDIRFTNFKKGYAETSRSTPYLILGVALLILFIACVNFINMGIAKSARRLKEIGMRKTLGASRGQLFVQFWFESLIVFTISMACGMLLGELLLDDFKSLFRTGATGFWFKSPWSVAAFLTAFVMVTFLVGGYPAWVLSRMGTVRSLKGKVLVNGKNRVRDTLIVFQFGIAILLITGTLVLRGQIDYMRTKDLGYDKEQVISFPFNGKKDSYSALELLRQELGGNPDILSISGADNNLGMGKDGTLSTQMIGFEHKGKVVRSNFLVVDHAYVSTLGLKMTKGRNFRDVSDSLGVLINEAMARQLGEEDPLSAALDLDDENLFQVYGVVKDYHFEDLDKRIEPLLFYMGKSLDLAYGYVKVAPGNLARSFDAVERAWKKVEPNSDFLGSFLDENIDRTFQREKSLAAMVTYGSIIAIVLSCIGLFAMSMLIVAQRTKEIGIRKVIGASVATIAYLLTKDFLKLVGLSFLVAVPVAWYFLREWLQNYAYRIDLSWWFFALSGLLVLGIAILTIGFKTVRAANANPVKSLRTE